MTLLFTNIGITKVLGEEKVPDIKDFKNILDVSGNPKIQLNDDYETNIDNPFSDMGAWHGYYLPKKDMKELYGGFPGPFIIGEEYPINLSNIFSKLTIINASNNTKYDLSKAKTSFDFYPGTLVQSYEFDDLVLNLRLIFATNRTA